MPTRYQQKLKELELREAMLRKKEEAALAFRLQLEAKELALNYCTRFTEMFLQRVDVLKLDIKVDKVEKA